MPTISCGAGRCMLTYYESRGLLNFNQVDNKWEIWGDPEDIEIVPNEVNAGFISDIRRLMDLRAANLDPETGAVEVEVIDDDQDPPLLKPKSVMPSHRTSAPDIEEARKVSRTRILASAGPISRLIAFWPPSPYVE